MSSIGAQTATALGGALLVALLAMVIAVPLGRWLSALRGRPRVFAWILLLAPLFTPPLLVSYALVKISEAMVVSAWAHEALYIGVLAVKLISVAVVLRTLFPSPLSAESQYLFRMMPPAGWRSRAWFHLRAAGHAPWIAGSLVFLLAFVDFAHFGQTSVLSAMMLAAFATPLVVLLLTGTARRLYARRHGR